MLLTVFKPMIPTTSQSHSIPIPFNPNPIQSQSHESCIRIRRVCRYVYQKAYVEFFTSPEQLAALKLQLAQHPSITWMAVNAAGDFASNRSEHDVNAVTWGVFPGARPQVGPYLEAWQLMLRCAAPGPAKTAFAW
jgi:hypothetical protein